MGTLPKNLSFSLIVCTYSRPESVIQLLESVAQQSLYPNEILIIDASEDDRTASKLSATNYKSLTYFKVDDENKGLTRQRNFGIKKANQTFDIICFLDDDIVLQKDYFEKLNHDKQRSDAVAVGGAIIDEGAWNKINEEYKVNYDEFVKDGYVRKLGSRNVLRKRLGLLSNVPPGFYA